MVSSSVISANSNSQPSARQFADVVRPQDQRLIDDRLSAWIYRTAVPFNVVECNEFKNFMKTIRPAYQPPSEKKLRTTLLDSAYERVTACVNRAIISSSDMISIVTDGWSNLRMEHLVNFVIVSKKHPPILYKTIDTKGKAQTGQEIADTILEVMEELGGITKVAGIVTDTAANMQSAWAKIEDKHPLLFCNPCAAHVLNLLVQDICEIPENESTLKKVVQISKFVKFRTAFAAALRELLESERKQGNTARFVALPVPTRWFTQYECVKKLWDLREQLCMLAAKPTLMSRIQTTAADDFKRTVLSEEFWRDVEKLASVLKPVSQVIGKAESNGASLDQVYKWFKELKENPVYGPPNLQELVTRRWDYITTENMLWSVFLDPKSEGGRNVLEVPDLKDAIGRLLRFLTKISGTEEECNETRNELAKFFRLVKKETGTTTDHENMEKVPTSLWWTFFGSSMFPGLYRLWCRFEVIPTSSAAAERVWSVFSLIDSKRRANLKAETTIKLASVYVNSALAAEFNQKAEENTQLINYIDEQLQGCDETISIE